MGNTKINDILIGKTSRASEQSKAKQTSSKENEEFKNLLKENIGKVKEEHGIDLSIHAAKRLNDRNINLDSSEYLKLKSAMETLREKGGKDSLVITGNAAYIVDVGNNKIVTAMDKNQMAQNVFTKIDSTFIVND